MRYLSEVKGELGCKVEAILSVPARRMCCVHYTFSALSLVLLPVLVYCYRKGLVVGEYDHVSPLFHHSADVALGCVYQFQLPTIVSSHLVGLFKLAYSSVGCYDDVHAMLPDSCELVEDTSHLLIYICEALAVPEVLYSCLAVLIADRLDAEPFCPVGCIEYKGLISVVILCQFR